MSNILTIGGLASFNLFKLFKSLLSERNVCMFILTEVGNMTGFTLSKAYPNRFLYKQLCRVPRSARNSIFFQEFATLIFNSFFAPCLLFHHGCFFISVTFYWKIYDKNDTTKDKDNFEIEF